MHMAYPIPNTNLGCAQKIRIEILIFIKQKHVERNINMAMAYTRHDQRLGTSKTTDETVTEQPNRKLILDENEIQVGQSFIWRVEPLGSS